MGNLRKHKRRLTDVRMAEPQMTPIQKAHMHREKGKYNGYKCEKCGVITLTVDRDEGVTPMFLACRAKSACDGMSVSLGYPPGPVPESLLPVQWEWYRPALSEIDSLEADMQAHVFNGGLVLRPIEPTGEPFIRIQEMDTELVGLNHRLIQPASREDHRKRYGPS